MVIAPCRPQSAAAAPAAGCPRAEACVEFLRMLLTICVRCDGGTAGMAEPPTASERCFACVRFLTSLESVSVSCCSRESAAGVGCESALRRSAASAFPCSAA